jgi:hypothetical protein
MLPVEKGISNFPSVTDTVLTVPFGVSLLKLMLAENVPVMLVLIIEVIVTVAISLLLILTRYLLWSPVKKSSIMPGMVVA